MLSGLRHSLSSLLFRARADRSLDAELEFHLEREIEKNISKGLPPAEAARKARIELGATVEHLKDQCRDEWRTNPWDNLRQDIPFAVRSLKTNPAFTLGALLTLALGIGANTALFSLVNGVLLKPLPFLAGERLVRIQHLTPAATFGISPTELTDLRTRAQSFEELVEFHTMTFILLGRREPEQVQVGVVSARYFDFLGVPPLLGRTFRPDEESHNAEPVLVLSHAYWKRSHGADPGVVGRKFRMNDRVHTVVGVLPPLPDYPVAIDVWMPVTSCPFRSAPATRQNRNARMITAIGRLKPGVASAAPELEALTAALRREHPEAYTQQPPELKLTTVSVHQELTEKARPTLLLLWAATTLVLLIACSNVASLNMARLLRRNRELAIRTAIGASRGRILQQLATESFLLAAGASLIGVALAAAALKGLTEFILPLTPRATEVALDTTALVFTLGLVLFTTLVFGVLPPLLRKENLTSSVKDGSPAVTQSTRARSALVAVQVALSFLLLIGAGLLARTVINLQSVDAGFQSNRVLTFRVSPNFSKYTTNDQYRSLFERMLASLRAEPGIESAAIAFKFPLDQRLPANQTLRLEGEDAAEAARRPTVDFRIVSDAYFETMRIPVVAGRSFSAADSRDAQPVAIVNDIMARRRWPGKSPIGHRIAFGTNQTMRTIVGVVGNVRQYGLDSEAAEELYMPFAQLPGGTAFVVRSAVEPALLASRIREVVYAIDPEQPVVEMRTMDEVRAVALASPQLRALLLTLFAGVTLLITVTGLSSVLSLAVTQRRNEISIRMALGASRSSVLGMVVRQGLTVVCLGLAAGLSAALLLTRLLGAFLFGIQPTDYVTYLAASVSLLLVAAIACALPARRAVAIDPVLALRSD
ncbi:MAG: ABC transporter permease [Bryobacteraceae bacterium]|nr:ABC transporter permease [Bryobacteraceae bacterium]